MADDKNHEQDPEEDKKDQFDDDDDFGLPDLEYDELDDDDDDFEEDVEVPDDFDDDVFGEDDMEDEEVKEEEEVQAASPVADSVDEDDDIEVDLSEMEDIELDDVDIDDIDDVDISDEELQAELDKLDDEGLDDIEESPEESPDFYEEESFDEFQEKEDVISDVFGADAGTGNEEVLGKDFKDKLVSGPTQTYSYSGGSSGARRGFARIVIIGTLVITAIAIALYLIWPGVTATEAEQPQVVEAQPEPQPAVEEPVEETPAADPEPEPAATPSPQPSQVQAGQITELDGQNGRSYIIVASFFDGDLAMDHAKTLAATGQSPYVIPPFGRHRFYRVAIAEFGDFNAAAGSLPNYQAEFGNDIWALRY